MADKTPYFACGCIQCGVMGDGACGAAVENLEGDIIAVDLISIMHLAMDWEKCPAGLSCDIRKRRDGNGKEAYKNRCTDGGHYCLLCNNGMSGKGGCYLGTHGRCFL